MSIRTVIEINHDMLRDLKEDPQWAQKLYKCLATQSWTEEDRQGLYTKFAAPNGVRVLLQRHHSDDLWIGYAQDRVKELG